MTARQLPGTGNATATPAATTTAASALPANSPLPASPSVSAAGLPTARLWEDWFQSADPNQQAEALALAARQGLLYGQQIPSLVNGQTNRLTSDCRTIPFAKLFRGPIDEVTPLDSAATEIADTALDPLQREAVARALGAPEIFLLHGYPGTGKSRIVAEILHQAALQGRRVLFLADAPAGLDVVLERLADRNSVYPVRFLEPGEQASRLPPVVQPWTLVERLRALREQTIGNLRQALESAKSRLERRRGEGSVWEDLIRLSHEEANLQEASTRWSREFEDVAAAVAREAATDEPEGAWQTELRCLEAVGRQSLATCDSQLQEMESQRPALERERKTAERSLQASRPLAEAKKKRRWWTLSWWRATLSGDVVQRAQESEAEVAAADKALALLEKSCQELRAQAAAAVEQQQGARERLVQEEIDRRRAGLAQRRDAWQRDWDHWAKRWRHACDSLEQTLHRPPVATVAAVEEAQNRWREALRNDEEACQFAERWAASGPEVVQELASRLLGVANVLAGTTAALAHDRRFVEAAKSRFDLLILEDADRLTEADLIRLAHYAPRCVLVASCYGEPEDANGTTEPKNAAAPKNSAATHSLRQGAFAKLWRLLHSGIASLPYSWFREGARLGCQLASLANRGSGQLEIEHVADYPEIELRIWSPAKSRPVLAQVIFPPGMGFDQAKIFLYRELQEAAVEGVGRTSWLRPHRDGWTLHLRPHPSQEAVPVELEAGLLEWIEPSTGHTCRLEFGSDWTRARVDRWLLENLRGRDLGRTIFLQTCYRHHASLAAMLGGILYADKAVAARGADSGVGADPGGVEFCAVPPLRKDHARKAEPLPRDAAAANGAAGFPREGAGLEHELGSNRSAERLPSELRACLPRKGFANYLEAQALIRALEELAVQPERANQPVAVVALSDAQVELLRTLASRSPSLGRLTLQFGPARQFHHQEFHTVFVSLTRSHSHRAVPLGETVSDLPLALSRARRRLVLFGDPGALYKRSQWLGPLEHHDANAAALEARRCAALVSHLQGHDASAGFRILDNP
ncbi:MAG: hypothetical protein HY040_04260 [Planctomycetes bacterium]|nr:hypothetical protein [Planctomycetota bacterium]